MFFYENWDVFKAAIRLRFIASDLNRYRTPRTGSDLDQLRRAASSILLNIAEGAKERHKGKKLLRYDTARASASECNSALLVLKYELTAAAAQELISEGRDLADRVSAMMTNLSRSVGNWTDDPPTKNEPQKNEVKPTTDDSTEDCNDENRMDDEDEDEAP